jgi:hypothetical protein
MVPNMRLLLTPHQAVYQSALDLTLSIIFIKISHFINTSFTASELVSQHPPYQHRLISNTMSNTPTPTWSVSTHEIEYSQFPDRFLQRNLAPTEYKLNVHGQTIVPVGVKARLQNEAACLRFTKSATNIPVPEVLAEYEQDGSYFL